MTEWEGFTDEALKQLTKSKENPRSLKHSGLKSVTSSKLGARKGIASKSLVPVQADKLNNDQKLSIVQDSGTEKCKESETKNESLPVKAVHKEPSTGTGPQESPSKLKEKDEDPFKDQAEDEVKSLIIDDSTIQEKEMVTIDKFRERQKEIEDLNKRKRAMLTNAISEKTKRSKEEAVKLALIRRELEALDHMVSSDVAIVRDRIEVVTRDYALSQRRYEHAEKEFIAAKIELHERSDLKQQLTEHLYTIIHQNELRKAQKLDQLTKQLDSNTKNDFPLEKIQEPTIIPSTLTSTIVHPDIQKFRHKLQTGLEAMAENNAEHAESDHPRTSDVRESDHPRTSDVRESDHPRTSDVRESDNNEIANEKIKDNVDV